MARRKELQTAPIPWTTAAKEDQIPVLCKTINLEEASVTVFVQGVKVPCITVLRLIVVQQ